MSRDDSAARVLRPRRETPEPLIPPPAAPEPFVEIPSEQLAEVIELPKREERA